MIKAASKLKDGRTIFIFGLSDGNVRRLKEGKPILFDLEPLGGVGKVAIMYGETEADIARELATIGELPS